MSKYSKDDYLPIPGFKDYKINIEGEIINKHGKKLIGLQVHNSGYVRINLRKNNKNYKVYLHRIIAKLFVPNPRPRKYKIVNHKDGVKSNFHYTNLEWCDFEENAKHSFLLQKQNNLCKEREIKSANLKKLV